MALYHLHIQIISRGKGKSAVSAAAYRSGEKITNDYDGMTHDYTRKGGIVHTEIMLPDNAPPEYINRSVLWNAVEQIEKNRNSQLAREIDVALPKELSHEQHIAIVREYCQTHFVSAGMACDMCFHTPKPKKGEEPNPHVHIMLTMRPFDENGEWGAKSKKEYILDENGKKIVLPSGEYKTRKINTTDWNDPTKAEEWRQGWADVVNRFLVQNGVAERVDNRSYERQGIDQLPTIHKGVAATQMERRGIVTDRGNINRQIIMSNSEIKQLRARLNKLKKWVNEQVLPTEKSINPISSINLQAVVSAIVSGGEHKDKYGKTHDLKAAAKLLVFLQNNDIMTMPQLAAKVEEMVERQSGISDQIKPKERRLKTLDEHLKNVEIYNKNKAVHRQYRQTKPKDQAAFYNAHSAEIILFEAAEKYLKGVLGDRDKIPSNAWRDEQVKLTAEKTALYQQYHKLKGEVAEVELIKKTMVSIVEDELGQEKMKVRDAEL